MADVRICLNEFKGADWLNLDDLIDTEVSKYERMERRLKGRME